MNFWSHSFLSAAEKFRREPLTLAAILLIVIGFWVRVAHLDQYPGQIHQDELSNIYDAYSISQTGADRWGVPAPVILRAFGENDYRPPLYCWLAAVSIKCFGYSVVAGRIPSAILGTISLILLFVVARRIWGTLFSIISLFVLVFCPWHIMMSRIALEAAILPSFFLLLTLYLAIRSKENDYLSYHVIVLGLCVGLATSAYQSTKLIFFVIALLLYWDLVRTTGVLKRPALVFMGAACLGAMPQLYALLIYPEHFFSRASATLMPPELSIQYFGASIKNFYLNLAPRFLFFDFGSYNNLTAARLLTSQFIFFYVGLATFAFQSTRITWLKPGWIYFMLFLCILPSALTYDNPHALRTSGVIALYPLLIASGILTISRQIKDPKLRIYAIILLCIVILANFTSAARTYLSSRKLIDAGSQPLLVSVAKKINFWKAKFNNIYLQDYGNQPYIYILYYCKVEPAEFLKMPLDVDREGWDHFYQMGKYHFVERDSIASLVPDKAGTSLIIAQKKQQSGQLLDSVGLEHEHFYFYRR